MKGKSKKGNYSSYQPQYASSASADTLSSKGTKTYMGMQRGPGMQKGGAHSSASSMGQRPPRPKEGRRSFVGGSNR